MSIVIIKYNAGNVFSVQQAFLRLGVELIATANRKLIESADKVIFPGVGEASSTMQYLHQTGLGDVILGLRQPVLGICLGMQLMCSHSEEGDVDCLNIFDAQVKRFVAHNPEDKIPHMGWNTLTDLRGQLFDGISASEYTYFVHSYYADLCSSTIATSSHILPFSAALHKDNFYATQFHPEKSGDVGEQILKNFLSI